MGIFEVLLKDHEMMRQLFKADHEGQGGFCENSGSSLRCTTGTRRRFSMASW